MLCTFLDIPGEKDTGALHPDDPLFGQYETVPTDANDNANDDSKRRRVGAYEKECMYIFILHHPSVSVLGKIHTTRS